MANIFLECLFHDVKLQYAVPIISQQGEVRGRRSPTHKQKEVEMGETLELRFNVGDLTGCRQVARRADARQRSRTGATLRRRRLV